MVDFITRTVGWKYSGRYNALSYEVNRLWERDADNKGSVEQLRQSVAIDSKLQVLIAHGWGDLSCPFMASVLIVDQMPVMGDPQRVQVKEYPGGHMFYSRGDSQAALRRDGMRVYAAHFWCGDRGVRQERPSRDRRRRSRVRAGRACSAGTDCGCHPRRGGGCRDVFPSQAGCEHPLVNPLRNFDMCLESRRFPIPCWREARIGP
jgi:hypothetical protein